MSDLIKGTNPVLELLDKIPESIEKICIRKGKKNSKISKILDLCRQNSVRFDFVSFMPEGINDSIVAYTEAFKYSHLKDIDTGVSSTLIILDNIEDPHNLGAVIRSAAGSGTGGVIIPERNACPVTDTVIKVSAGTAFKIPVIRVKNTVSAIKELKEKGYWVTGTDMSAQKDFRKYDYTQKAVIVIGSEGKGMRRLVRENCDDVVRIDLKNGVESLNASVAAALILFETARR